MAMANFGGDTGDSFLSAIDSAMGAPPITDKHGRKQKDAGDGGETAIQGIFKALGIGNKNIEGKQSSTDAIQGGTLAPPPKMALDMKPALSPEALAPSAESSAIAAAQSGNLLADIFKHIGAV